MNSPQGSSKHLLYLWTGRRVRDLSLGAAAIALLTPLASIWWVADLIANLRVQLVCGLLAAFALAVVFRRTMSAAGLLVVVGWQSSWLMPAFLPVHVSAHSAETLRICVANVLTVNTQHDRILQELTATNADLLIVLELSSALDRRLRDELRFSHPHALSEPEDRGNFGIGIFSRLPLQNARVFTLTHLPLPSLEADVEFDGQPVRIFATHPVPPMNAANFGLRNQQLKRLAERILEVRRADAGLAIIVAGDLNLTPWSPIFRNFLTSADLVDASASRGLTPTWYRLPYALFGLMIDHGLHSANLGCHNRDVLPDVGSDHRPVLLEFHQTRK